MKVKQPCKFVELKAFFPVHLKPEALKRQKK